MALTRKWRLGSETSGVTPSALGDGLDGTLSPSYPTNAPALAGGICSNLPGSMLFDGSDDYVALPEGSGTLGNCFSISAWVYPKDLNRRTIFSSSVTFAQPNLGISTNYGEGSLEVVIPGIYVIGSAAGVVVANKWQLITWAHYSQISTQFFVNGMPVTTDPINTIFDATPRIAYVGCRSPSVQTWNGNIMEVSIYDHGLTAAEVWALYEESRRDNAFLMGQP